MTNNTIPMVDVGVVGPGSHVEEDTLNYMPMPHEMNIYEVPVLPEAETVHETPELMALLGQLQEALDEYRPGMEPRVIDLAKVSAQALTLLAQILGEGEVAVQLSGATSLQAQETVLAGVWWVHFSENDEKTSQWLEIADLPGYVKTHAFDGCEVPAHNAENLPQNLVNAAPVVTELLDTDAENQQQSRTEAHVINLSLLPFVPEDHDYLAQVIGEGRVKILSRGYGNCRITASAVPGIWRVQYFNSTDKLILDTLEVIDMPQVACAAKEDLEDSAERLEEMREALV